MELAGASRILRKIDGILTCKFVWNSVPEFQTRVREFHRAIQWPRESLKQNASGNNRGNLVGEVRHAGCSAGASTSASKQSATFVARNGKRRHQHAQLRELVIQLTKIAIKNITDPARRVN
jgi:hypothetical protein